MATRVSTLSVFWTRTVNALGASIRLLLIRGATGHVYGAGLRMLAVLLLGTGAALAALTGTGVYGPPATGAFASTKTHAENGHVGLDRNGAAAAECSLVTP